MIIPLTGLSLGVGFIFFTAVNRLVATLFPIVHIKLNKLLYLGSIFGICFGHSIYILYNGYLNADENKDITVICFIVEGK